MSDHGSIGGEDRPTSRYREIAPPASLSRHLVCTWTQSIGPGGTDYLQRVLPDGCVDIVWIGEAAPVVVGPATRAVIAPLPAGSIIVGARFRPGLAPGFLGPPANELLNEEIPLVELWGSAASQLSLRMAEARATEDKLAVMGAALASRPVHAGRADLVVGGAVAWLARHPSGRIGEISRQIGISSRQLQRRFDAAVGYGPKTLQRILRFQRLLALARRRRTHPAALALDAGYADQAHMSREVRALAGVPPRTLFSNASSTLSMSDLFKT